MTKFKALTFDTGGTILDWHTGIAAELGRIGKRRGVEADWAKLTNKYRIESLKHMTGGADDFQPAFNIDDVHREQIETVIREFGLDGLTEEDFDRVRDAWHALDCWPDVPEGLARLRHHYLVASLTILSVRLITDTCKPAGIQWDAVISCEMIGTYKPRPLAYQTAAKWLQLEPSECLMVAAHPFDLEAASAVGYNTAYVKRPAEFGPDFAPRPYKSKHKPDFEAENFLDLADQLGCA